MTTAGADLKAREEGRSRVDAYLAAQPAASRAALARLRGLIRRAAPSAEEVISYGMPAFRQGGMLVFYAGFKDHCSFFVGSQITQRKFSRELRPFIAGKGTVHFTPGSPLPADLVRRIVLARVAENTARLSSKPGGSRAGAAGRRRPTPRLQARQGSRGR